MGMEDIIGAMDIIGQQQPGMYSPYGANPAHAGGYGYDRMGECPPNGNGGYPCYPTLGAPGYLLNGLGAPWGWQGGGVPAQCMPNGNGYGNGAAEAAAASMMAAAANGGAPPAAMAQVSGGNGWGNGGLNGWGGGFGPWGCFPGGPVAPHLVQQVQEPAVFLRPRCPTRIRTEYVGFGTHCIKACSEKTIVCTVQDLTKIIRLVIPKDVGYQLAVTAIDIGKECIVNCDALPAIMFAEDATDVLNLQWPTIQACCAVEITLRNTSEADVCVTFGAVARVVS